MTTATDVIALTDIATGVDIQLPARFTTGASAKLTVTMRGHGFGTIRHRLDPYVNGGPVAFFS